MVPAKHKWFVNTLSSALYLFHPGVPIALLLPPREIVKRKRASAHRSLMKAHQCSKAAFRVTLVGHEAFARCVSRCSQMHLARTNRWNAAIRFDSRLIIFWFVPALIGQCRFSALPVAGIVIDRANDVRWYWAAFSHSCAFDFFSATLRWRDSGVSSTFTFEIRWPTTILGALQGEQSHSEVMRKKHGEKFYFFFYLLRSIVIYNT